ncbi:MAG: hypothetical protein M1818_006180 [Claussenomyces sp. TS43310]|nr:MAG: hypothetical protein M1818_006180 [Claussenomyces sp. TS43310]
MPNGPHSSYGPDVTSGFQPPYGSNPPAPLQGYPQVSGPNSQAYPQPGTYAYGPLPPANTPIPFVQQACQQGPYGYSPYPEPQENGYGGYGVSNTFGQSGPPPNYNASQSFGPPQTPYGAIPSPQQQSQWPQPPAVPSPSSAQEYQHSGHTAYLEPPQEQHKIDHCPSHIQNSTNYNTSGQHRSPIHSQLRDYPIHVEPSRFLGKSSAHHGWQASVSQTSIQHQAEADEEYDHDFMYAFKATTFSPAISIGRPLPSSYSEEPVPSPALSAPGLLCKYVRPRNLEIYIRDIRKSPHWPFVKNDTVFNEIAWDSPTVPLDEVVAWVHNRNRQVDVGQHGSPEISGTPRKRARSTITQEDVGTEISREAVPENSCISPRQAKSPNLKPIDDVATRPSGRPETPRVGREVTPSFGAEDDAWAPQPDEGRSTPVIAADPTEALLASLGVSGSPKPVQEKPVSFSAFVVTGPSAIRGFEQSVAGDSHSIQDTDANMAEPDERINHRQDSGYASSRGSHSKRLVHSQSQPQMVQSSRGNLREDHRPPPPPPRTLRRQMDGSFDSPDSDGSARDAAYRIYCGGVGVTDQNASVAAQDSVSPLTPTSAELLGQMPLASQEHNDGKPAPLRQLDDVTPKLKKRQPKVADAYR